MILGRKGQDAILGDTGYMILTIILILIIFTIVLVYIGRRLI